MDVSRFHIIESVLNDIKRAKYILRYSKNAMHIFGTTEAVAAVAIIVIISMIEADRMRNICNIHTQSPDHDDGRKAAVEVLHLNLAVCYKSISFLLPL